ncbi:hypothetical protein L1887_57087 [Cichorium endivia]|nr:hypothetical protein L1887_57087 [Cichorium endivia]
MHHVHLCKHLFVLQFCRSVSAVRDSGTGRGWPRQDPGRIGCEPMASADLRERRCDNDGGLDPWVAGARQRRADGGGAVAWMRDLPGSELQISAKKTVADERKRKLGTFSDAAFDVILSRRALSSLEPTAWQESRLAASRALSPVRSAGMTNLPGYPERSRALRQDTFRILYKKQRRQPSFFWPSPISPFPSPPSVPHLSSFVLDLRAELQP